MTITHTTRRSVLTLLAILAMAPMARAQEIAGTFDQLRVLIKPGDTITITDDAGVQTKGRLTELSPVSLALLVDGNQRVLSAESISTIHHRRSDPLANGARWGLGVGVVVGLGIAATVAADFDDSPDAAIFATGALIYGALGAGIGAGLDALNQSPQVIYARPRTTARRLSIAPMMGKRRGVALMVGF